MKFVWAQDFDFIVHGGGAQLTDRAHFFAGIRRGHEISIWNPGTPADLSDSTLIASNPVFLPHGTYEQLKKDGRPYIWFLHDYWPLCKYRLFYPMQEDCGSCYLKERWLPALMNAEMLIWLSPLHREAWLALAPELKDMHYHLAPSSVDVRGFFNMEQERSGVIAVESLHPFKGRKHVIKWAEEYPSTQVNILGGDPIGEPLPRNIKVLDQVPYFDMNKLYNQHIALLHLPQSPSPFDRVTAEAYLAGCDVIGNKLIGALSYDWFIDRDEVAHHVSESPVKFWKAVEEVLQ